MRSKIFLASLLLTPLLVLLISTLSFQSGYSPKSTKNNGIFFTEYFDATKLNLIDDVENLKFEDGKWLFATYASNGEEIAEALYLMRQLNVALNRDINRLKRVSFYSNKLIEKDIEAVLAEYPRLELIEDVNGVLLNVLQKNSKTDFNVENPIFVIDPYGRAVIYFNSDIDPKLILKDLKVLI